MPGLKKLIGTKSNSMKCTKCQKSLQLKEISEGRLFFACEKFDSDEKEPTSMHTAVLVDPFLYSLEDFEGLEIRDPGLPF